ncbi:MAG: TraR/DksA family transcriptional regulator [Elusimicrobia bacterium]|nr:TraR/DksA family transcriptional regulator [Elusimicrobiota bacterium]
MTKKLMKKPATSSAKPKASAGGSAKDLAWLTPAKLKSIRTELVSMRDDILRTVRKQSIGDVDNGDSVDQASQSIEKELMFELSDNERTTLDMVEAAIRKIDNGTYGLCEATQKPITRARLEAIPYARYSIAYQNQIEQKVTEAAEPGLDFSVIGETERAGE